MKYEKAKAEVVKFQDTEFFTGSGNWDGGYCKNYRSSDGRVCGYVHPCPDYNIGNNCDVFFECDEYSRYGLIYSDRWFVCLVYS